MKYASAHAREQEIFRITEDPALFAMYFLAQDPWLQQQRILRSVAKHSRTAVKACHASGKTFAAAAAALWWLQTHEEGVVVTTAPTWTQVEQVLWKEIHKSAEHSSLDFGKRAATALHISPSRYAIGLSTNKGVRFQGFHGSVLVILDEAPGVLPDIYEAVEGIRAGGDVRVLALGNPTIASGPFYEAFTTNRAEWNVITISAFDTPNLEGITLESLLEMPEDQLDQNPRPYLTTRRWVREKYHDWGNGHPLWESRVLGNFPAQSEDALISLTWLEQARNRELPIIAGPIEAGVDVAEGGDNETVLCVRQGPRILEIRSWAQRDPRGAVVEALRPYRDSLTSVKVDKVGVGAYFEKHLADEGFPTTGVNVGETPLDDERFANLKAELYWALRERLERGTVCGALSEKAIAQLASIRYSINSRGKIVIESKEQMLKRGAKSPDHAEAVMLAFGEVDYAVPNIRLLW
jgi:phage terminase large subunit